jgi:hypothetical protein
MEHRDLKTFIIVILCVFAYMGCKKSTPAPITIHPSFDYNASFSYRRGYISQTSPTNVTVTLVDDIKIINNQANHFTNVETLEDFSHTEMGRLNYSYITYGEDSTAYPDSIPLRVSTYNPSFAKKDTMINGNYYTINLFHKTIVFSKNFSDKNGAEGEIQTLKSLSFTNNNVDAIHYQIGIVSNPFPLLDPIYAAIPVVSYQ